MNSNKPSNFYPNLSSKDANAIPSKKRNLMINPSNVDATHFEKKKKTNINAPSYPRGWDDNPVANNINQRDLVSGYNDNNNFGDNLGKKTDGMQDQHV